jgi:hypothetical protein
MKYTETDLVNELFKSVEALGINATTDALRVARNSTLTLQDKRVEFVLKMTAEQYMQPVDEIINSRNKSVKRMLAMKFSIFYLHESFGFSFSNLKLIFKRDKSLLCRSVKEIKGMVSENPVIEKVKNKFDLLITDFKLKNESK